MVRVAGLVDAISHCAAGRRVAADQRSRRAVFVRGQSISESSSAHGACRALAILVHYHRREAGDWRMVASTPAGRLCSYIDDWAGWKNWHGAREWTGHDGSPAVEFNVWSKAIATLG